MAQEAVKNFKEDLRNKFPKKYVLQALSMDK